MVQQQQVWVTDGDEVGEGDADRFLNKGKWSPMLSLVPWSDRWHCIALRAALHTTRADMRSQRVLCLPDAGRLPLADLLPWYSMPCISTKASLEPFKTRLSSSPAMRQV